MMLRLLDERLPDLPLRRLREVGGAILPPFTSRSALARRSTSISHRLETLSHSQDPMATLTLSARSKYGIEGANA